MIRNLEPRTLNPKPNAGFTLIEILIVAAITAIFSAYLLLYKTTGRNQTAMYIEAAKIAQVVFRAKSIAISGFTDPSAPCGYGVHVDRPNKKYILFSYKTDDCNNIQSIDPQDAAKFTAMESFTLAAGLDFRSTATDLVDVLFIPPDPQVLIGHGAILTSSGSGDIIVRTENGSAETKITVSGAGQITF